MNSFKVRSHSLQSMAPNLQLFYNIASDTNIKIEKTENFENDKTLKDGNVPNPKSELTLSHVEPNAAKSTVTVSKDINSLDQVETVKCREKSLNNITNSESVTLKQEDSSNLLFCRETLETAQDYKNHEYPREISESLPKPLKCKYCSLSFTKKNILNKHVRGHKRNNCTVCKTQFTKRKALCEHLKVEHNIIQPERIYACSFCDQSFTKKTYLIEHLKTHADGRHVCFKCGFMSASDTEYTQHMNEHVKQSRYDCHLCGKKFVRRQQHDQHMMGHNRHSCSPCNISFSTKKLLRKHQRSVHGIHVELLKRFNCNVCKKSFVSCRQLLLHTRIHTGERPHKCSHCDKSFRNRRSFNIHMKSARHLQRVNVQEGKVVEIERPFGCDECGTRYYRQQSLLRHKEVLHSISETFQCSQCEYSSKCKANLKRHEECHSDVKRFICEICGLSFRALTTLKEHHVFLHTEDRQFTCDICSKSFKSKSTLQRHYKTHCEIRPFKCHCDKDFKRLSHLKRHMASVHRIASQNDASEVSDGNQTSNDKESDDITLADSIDTLSQISQETLTSLIVPISNSSFVETSPNNDTVEDYICSASNENQYPHVPSASIHSLITDSVSMITNNDPKGTQILLSQNTSPEISTVSLDNLNLSPSRFCNFSLVSSSVGIDNSLHDTVAADDILSFTEQHSTLDYRNHSASYAQLPQNSDGLQMLSFLLNGSLSSPPHSNDLQQDTSSKNLFGDSDDSLSFSPYSCSIPPGCASDNLFSNVRDIDLWDTHEQINKFKPSNDELSTNENFATNVPPSTSNILPHNILFTNESLMVCALDLNALNSDLDSLTNLC